MTSEACVDISSQLIESLPSLQETQLEKFKKLNGISLIPLFISGEQLIRMESQLTELASALIEVVDCTIRRKGLNQVLREFGIPKSHFERFAADTVCPKLQFMRPDGILCEDQFMVFESNFSSSSYGLSASETTNRKFESLLQDTSLENINHRGSETLETTMLFREALQRLLQKGNSEFWLLNDIESTGLPCDTEIENWSQELSQASVTSKVHFIQEKSTVKDNVQIQVWKTYHSPDQMGKNTSFLDFWQLNQDNDNIEFLDSIYELLLSNKYFLSQIDPRILNLKTRSLSTLQIDPSIFIASKNVFKIGNAAASHGVLLGRDLSSKNWAHFCTHFVHPHTIVQEDVTELSMYPYFGWTDRGFAFGYAPLVISPLFLNGRIIGFANSMRTPYGRWTVPTFKSSGSSHA